MSLRIDTSLYPDAEAPHELCSMGDRIDFIARLCGAWDFGILPDLDVVAELRKPEWREAVRLCRLDTCATYHLLRRWQGLPEVPFLGSLPACVTRDPNLVYL
jgi:hypothetical protein